MLPPTRLCAQVMEKAINIIKKPKQQVVPPHKLVTICVVLVVFLFPAVTCSPLPDLLPSPLEPTESTINVSANTSHPTTVSVDQQQQQQQSSVVPVPINQSVFEFVFGYHDPKASFAFDIVSRVLIFVYCCLVIGYLCDEFFVPSLESIGHSLDWPSDLIGAILIPLGTSGPEIFSSAVGVFFAENDIGTGAILGSAVFNMLAIPAASGVAAFYFLGDSIALDELPVLRDLVFYIVSIVVLILVIKDNSVDLLDSSLMLIMFIIYIVVMVYSAKYNRQANNNNNNNNNKTNSKPAKLQTHTQNATSRLDAIKTSAHSPGYQITQWTLKGAEVADINNNSQKGSLLLRYDQEDEEMEAGGAPDEATSFYNDLVDSLLEHKQLLQRNKSDYEKIGEEIDDNGVGFTDHYLLRWLLLPFIIIFRLTMPRRFQVIIFFMSICWLSTLSYVTVWSINGLSELLAIPSTISGLTILAAGSAVPDLVTSIIVIKKTGKASMSICAAIASNIFAILLGLALPWAIQFALNWHQTGVYSRSAILLESSALPYIAIVLLGTIFALYFTFTICEWRLSKRFAIICFSIHVLFIVSCCCMEVLPKYTS